MEKVWRGSIQKLQNPVLEGAGGHQQLHIIYMDGEGSYAQILHRSAQLIMK